METLKQKIEPKAQLKEHLSIGRSPFTAKSVLFAGALFIAVLGYWVLGSDKDTSVSWLQAASPATMAITGSYLGGFLSAGVHGGQ